MQTQLRRLGLGLAGLTITALTLASAGSASHAGPVYLGDQNLSTSMTSIRAIANEPAFYATNEWGNGIAAISYAPVGIGVYGSHEATTGSNPGVRGDTSSPISSGVEGHAVGAGNGVLGVSESGVGLFGHSFSGTGVYGQSGGAGNGVEGFASAEGSAAVKGLHLGNSAPAYGVYGEGVVGVYGETRGGDNYGQLGTSSAGVVGEEESELGIGVWGLSSNGYAAYFDGNVHVTGTLTKDAGAFRIDHPLDPAGRYLQHSFVESPDMKNVYDGVVTTDRRGFATVRLPRYFQALNRDFRYQLTIVGRQFAQALVWREIENNRFTIRTDKPRVKVSWQVTGIRKDAYANANRIEVEVRKPAREQGRYLHPELYGEPERLSVDYPKLQRLRAERRLEVPSPPRLRGRR